MKLMLVLLVLLSWVYSAAAVVIPLNIGKTLIQQQTKIFNLYKKLNRNQTPSLLYRFDDRPPSNILVNGFKVKGRLPVTLTWHVSGSNLGIATSANPLAIGTVAKTKASSVGYVYAIVPDKTFYDVTSSFNRYHELYVKYPNQFDPALNQRMFNLMKIVKRESEWLTVANIAPERIVSIHSFLMNQRTILGQVGNPEEIESLIAINNENMGMLNNLLNTDIIKDLDCTATTCHMYNAKYNSKLTPTPNTDPYPFVEEKTNSYTIMENNGLYELDKVHDAPRLTEINNRLLDKTNNICK